jgi:hypothetical protein
LGNPLKSEVWLLKTEYGLADGSAL